MNKFLQWLKSIQSRLTGTFSSGKDFPPVIPREDPDARRERIIKNVISGFAEPGAQPQVADTHANYTHAVLDGKTAGLIPKAVDIPPVIDDHTGLGPTAAKRVATMPDLKSKMKITQSGLDQEIADLAQGDLKAAAALRMMAVMAPAYGDLDPNGPLSVFDLVRQAGLSGKEIGTFYEMCHSHPVKALGVLYAKEHLGLYRNYPLKGQVAAYGKPNAQPFRVNHMVDQAEWAISSANSLAMIQGVKPAKTPVPAKNMPRYSGANPLTYEDVVGSAVRGARVAEDRAAQQPGKPGPVTRMDVRQIRDSDSFIKESERLIDNRATANDVVVALATKSPQVDRGNPLGALAPLLTLDSANIYGKDIVTLHRLCNENPYSMLGVLRAHDLGFVSKAELKASIAGKEKLDVNGLLFKVVETLPDFSFPLAQGGMVESVAEMPPYKFDRLVEDVKSGNWEGIESQARAGNVRVSVEPINPERRFDGKGYVMSMTRMADGDPAITNMLMGIVAASQKVDPANLEAHSAPLKALDEAGIYGKDIEGLYQICGRHPGKMVALLRATTLGLVDAPAIKAALKPVGILRAGGLDVDGITKEVESSVPEFSVSRVEPNTLTGPKAPNLHADIERFAREGQGHPQPGQEKGGIGGTDTGHGGR